MRLASFVSAVRAAAALGLVVAATVTPAATLVHAYDLNGNLDDSVGSLPLLSEGGTLGATGYSFAANQGLRYQEILGGLASAYTIDMAFSLAAVDGWRKLVDFKTLQSDDGLYVFESGLQFFPATTHVGSIASHALVRATLTRDETGNVSGYLNGAPVWQFSDIGGIAVGGPNDNARFFIDDLGTGQSEASGGFVDYIRLYDGALTATEISAVPEPATWMLLLAGAALLARRLRRPA